VIYLVRHGQTEFNRERRLQGHVDSALTELGLRQAEAVARLLKDLTRAEPGWRVISSPLGRARRTAEFVAEALNSKVEEDQRLIELSWGEWDGRLRSELEAAHPHAFGRSGWAFDAPTGESYAAVCARVSDWLASLPPEPERRIVAVSHGVAGRVMRGVYAGLERDRTVEQDVPQDAVYVLKDGTIGRIDCEPLD
jgi:probable phosphoglycerate mutase